MKAELRVMSNSIIRIMAVGDVVGKSGLEFIRKNLWNLRKEQNADIVIVNGENSAPGNGITKDSAETLLFSGADAITTGNHVFRRAEIYSYLDDNQKVLRPVNYPASAPGFGYGIFALCGVRILIMNLLGTVYMESLESPFAAAERILEKETGNYDVSVADIHAEATSEKLAFANFFDGRINVVFGTHTHVQTSDARVLPGGTGYITDLGMTGVTDSVLGVKKETVIKKFLTKMPVRFDEAEGSTVLNGAVFEYDLSKRRTVFAKEFSFSENTQ